MIARLLLRLAIALNGGACPCPQCAAIRARSLAVSASTGRMRRQQRRELHRESWEHLRR